MVRDLSGCGYYSQRQFAALAALLEIYSITSATLHSYIFSLWSNYDHGKKKTLSNPESDLLSGFDDKERMNMSNSNNNRINVPQAKEAMNQFKMQAAQDEDVLFTS